jgi:hypothetical protein
MIVIADSWNVSLVCQGANNEAANLSSCVSPNIDESNIAYDAKTYFVVAQAMVAQNLSVSA